MNPFANLLAQVNHCCSFNSGCLEHPHGTCPLMRLLFVLTKYPRGNNSLSFEHILQCTLYVVCLHFLIISTTSKFPSFDFRHNNRVAACFPGFFCAAADFLEKNPKPGIHAVTFDCRKRRPIMKLYRDWETDRKSTRLNSSHSAKSRMPSSA